MAIESVNDFRSYCELKTRITILRLALAAGHPVQDKLRSAESELERAPRGNNQAFAKLCLFFLVTLTLAVFFYVKFEWFFLDLHGSPDSWYLKEFRPVASWTWKTSIALSSAWSAVLPALLLFVLWSIQRRLLRWHATAVIRAVGLLEGIAVAFWYVSWWSLWLGPLLVRAPHSF